MEITFFVIYVYLFYVSNEFGMIFSTNVSLLISVQLRIMFMNACDIRVLLKSHKIDVKFLKWSTSDLVAHRLVEPLVSFLALCSCLISILVTFTRMGISKNHINLLSRILDLNFTPKFQQKPSPLRSTGIQIRCFQRFSHKF